LGVILIKVLLQQKMSSIDEYDGERQKPFYVILGGECREQKRDHYTGSYQLTGKTMCIKKCYRFATKEYYNGFDDYLFEHLEGDFDEKNQYNYKGYFLDERLEPFKHISEEEAMKLKVVRCIDEDPFNCENEYVRSYYPKKKSMDIKPVKQE